MILHVNLQANEVFDLHSHLSQAPHWPIPSLSPFVFARQKEGALRFQSTPIRHRDEAIRL
jgi:hypothetical protein